MVSLSVYLHYQGSVQGMLLHALPCGLNLLNSDHLALSRHSGAAKGTADMLLLQVEQLLRTTDVSRIYVLIRGKRGCTAQERLARLLQSGLFHMVRDSPTLLAKVTALGVMSATNGSSVFGGD